MIRFTTLMSLLLAVLTTSVLRAESTEEQPADKKQKGPLVGGTGPAQSGFKGFEPTNKLPKRPADEPVEENPDFVSARQLFWSGSYDQAERLFLTYLEKNPNHEPTKVFLQMIHEARHYDPEKERVVRKALEEVRFKHIEWKEMSLDAAINYLRSETRRQIPEGETVNFINLVPSASTSKTITLSAEDATLDQLIRRISEQAGVFHRVGSDGVVFETKARS